MGGLNHTESTLASGPVAGCGSSSFTSIATLAQLPGALCLALALSVVMGGLANPVLAQPDDRGSAKKKKGERDQRARVLYKEGEGDYAAGRYEEAAAKFQEAYKLSKRPALLFNLANAYERMGEYQKAADNLERYLDSPKVKDVVSVRERIRRLESAVESQREAERKRARDAELAKKTAGTDSGAGEGGAGTGKTDTDQKQLVDDPRPKDGNKRDGQRKLRPIYALGATSAVALIGTVAFGIAASSAAGDAEAYCMDPSGSGLCQDAAKDAINRERRYALLADLSFSVAAISAGVGLYLFLRSRSKRDPGDRQSKVVPIIVPNGLGLGVSGAL